MGIPYIGPTPGYAMARVKLGDYYYYGQGTEVNYEAAASQYRIASDKQSSAQAMYNLAYMYQQGYGLKKVSSPALTVTVVVGIVDSSICRHSTYSVVA